MTAIPRVLLASSILLAELGFARAALSQEQVALTYQVPRGCPTEDDFVAAVVARGAHFDDARAKARILGMEVEIRQGAAGFSGALRVRTERGPSALREVRDAECAPLVDALAAVAAIALREQEKQAPAQEPAPPVEVASPAPTPEHAASNAAATPREGVTAVPPPQAEEKPRLRGSTFRLPESATVTAGKMRFDRATSYTLLAGAAFNVLPRLVLPRYDLDITSASFVTPPTGSSYLTGPVVRVRFGWMGPGSYHDGEYSARAGGFSTGVSVCSALSYDTQGLVALLCSDFGLNIVNLEIKGPNGTKSTQTGQGVAGISWGSQYNFAKFFHADFRLGGQFQVGKLSAQRTDGSVLFESGLFAAYAQAGLGMHF